MSKHPDLSGRRFGRLTAIQPAVERVRNYFAYHCRCECGKELLVPRPHLLSGNNKSCGCLKSERAKQLNYKHGKAKTPTWVCWQHMLTRCYDPKARDYRHYGGRGIRVCDQWRGDYSVFECDMGTRPTGMTIERIDNDGNYTPDNCRWADRLEQSNNRRTCRKVTAFGITLNEKQWCRAAGFRQNTVGRRLDYGWDVERAILAPNSVSRRQAWSANYPR